MKLVQKYCDNQMINGKEVYFHEMVVDNRSLSRSPVRRERRRNVFLIHFYNDLILNSSNLKHTKDNFLHSSFSVLYHHLFIFQKKMPAWRSPLFQVVLVYRFQANNIFLCLTAISSAREKRRLRILPFRTFGDVPLHWEDEMMLYVVCSGKEFLYA